MLSYSYDGKTGTSPSAIYGNHGTQCAGIIGAEKDNEFCIAGVSPQCKLMSLSNDFNQNSNGLPNDPNLDEHLAQSIEKAANHGADVISNSWGGGSFSTNITNAINYAATQGRNGLGCSVIFASGNNNQSSCGYPSSLPNVIAVGAMDRCGYRSGKAVTTGTCDPWSSGEQGSNYGSELDVVAPSHVYSTSGYNLCNPNFGGTSSACPHVAGVAALVLSILPCASSKDVQDIIESTCQKLGTFIYSNGVNGHPNGSWSDTVGHGMIDASAAVNSASFVKNSLSLHPYIQNKIYTSSKIEVNPDFIIAGNNVYPNLFPFNSYPNLFPFNSYPHGNVVIETNIAVKFKASQYIKIKEGFLAKRGSKFIAEVKKYNSIYGCRAALVTAKRVIKSSPISKNEALDILLYPNPFTANFFLEFDLIKSANVQIIISTITGQVIYNSDKFMENNHYKLEFERIGNDEILIIKLIKGNEISIHKIIHTNNN